MQPNNGGLASLTRTLLMPITLLFVLASGDSLSKQQGHHLYHNISSPWLKKVGNHRQPREPGCARAPWICRDQSMNHRGPPGRPRMRCCRNQCVDVSSDINNCGLCGIRCPFSWLCCRGLCVNTNVSPFNCGRCFNRCPWGVQCAFGMCGYGGVGGGGQPQPWPRPWPRPPKRWPHPRPRPPRLPQPPCPPGDHPSGIVK